MCIWPDVALSSLDQQCTAGAVCGWVNHDQGATNAIVHVRLNRQRLLCLNLDSSDLIDSQFVRFLIYQRVDIETVVDGCDTSLHPTVAMADPVLAANNCRFCVQPGQGGLEAVGRLDAAW